MSIGKTSSYFELLACFCRRRILYQVEPDCQDELLTNRLSAVPAVRPIKALYKTVQLCFSTHVLLVLENRGKHQMSSLITSRRLSILVVFSYAVVFAIAASNRSASEVVKTLLPIAGYLILPLACIWYGDEMGEYVGTLPGPSINRQTPGWMVKVGGWFLLLLPAIIVLVGFLNE